MAMPVGGAYDQRPEAGDETGPVQQGTCNSLGKKGWHWCSCVGASYSGCLPRPSGENIITLCTRCSNNMVQIQHLQLRSGGKDLTSSAQYPDTFGERIAKLHRSWIATLLSKQYLTCNGEIINDFGGQYDISCQYQRGVAMPPLLRQQHIKADLESRIAG